MQDEQTKDKVIDQLVTDQVEPGEADKEDGIISTTGLVRRKEQVERDEEYVDRVQKVREADAEYREQSAELSRQRGGIPLEASEEEIEEQRKAEAAAQKQLAKEAEKEAEENDERTSFPPGTPTADIRKQKEAEKKDAEKAKA